MSKMPKSPAPEKPPKIVGPESGGEKPEEVSEKRRKQEGKYYYDDAYGYEDYDPELDEDEDKN